MDTNKIKSVLNFMNSALLPIVTGTKRNPNINYSGENLARFYGLTYECYKGLTVTVTRDHEKDGNSTVKIDGEGFGYQFTIGSFYYVWQKFNRVLTPAMAKDNKRPETFPELPADFYKQPEPAKVPEPAPEPIKELAPVKKAPKSIKTAPAVSEKRLKVKDESFNLILLNQLHFLTHGFSINKKYWWLNEYNGALVLTNETTGEVIRRKYNGADLVEKDGKTFYQISFNNF